MIGNMLRDRDVQYVAIKDDLTNTWRILDTWHEDLKSLQPEDEIDDDSEAVKILTEGEFISIVKEAARTGVLANANFGTGEAELEATILEKDQEIQILSLLHYLEKSLLEANLTDKMVRQAKHEQKNLSANVI